jgi:hypothetical protein
MRVQPDGLVHEIEEFVAVARVKDLAREQAAQFTEELVEWHGFSRRYRGCRRDVSVSFANTSLVSMLPPGESMPHFYARCVDAEQKWGRGIIESSEVFIWLR